MARNNYILLTLCTGTIILHASQDIKVEYNIGNNIDLIDNSTNKKIGSLQCVGKQTTNLPFQQQISSKNSHQIQSSQCVVNHSFFHRVIEHRKL